MTVCVGSLSPLLRRKTLLGWGGALAVGFAAVGWRSISSGATRVPSPWTCRHPRALSTIISRSSLFSTITSNPSMSLTPPQAPPEWNHSASDILKLTKEAIASDRELQDKIGALAAKDCTYASVSNSMICGIFY